MLIISIVDIKIHYCYVLQSILIETYFYVFLYPYVIFGTIWLYVTDFTHAVPLFLISCQIILSFCTFCFIFFCILCDLFLDAVVMFEFSKVNSSDRLNSVIHLYGLYNDETCSGFAVSTSQLKGEVFFFWYPR